MTGTDHRSVPVSLLQLAPQVFQDATDVLEDIAVPVPDYPIASRSEPFGSGGVVGDLLGVLATVNFDDQARLLTEEIGDVVADWDLVAEMEGAKGLGAEEVPEATLRVGEARAKRFGVIGGGEATESREVGDAGHIEGTRSTCLWLTPSPTLPQGGGRTSLYCPVAFAFISNA
jgi:hypothetical protein